MRGVTPALARRLAAEALGTGLLVTVVVGSGIMGQSLAPDSPALALLGNTLATGAALTVLITVFAPLSGAHFNPAVTAIFAWRREFPALVAAAYIAAQCVGALLGAACAHLMFDQPLVQVSARLRDGPAQVFSEAVATFGLILVILGCLRVRRTFVPAAVGLYMTAAYWFTASTSFANPAVTLARSFSDTFSGIAPASAPLFVLGQLVGAGAATVVADWLYGAERAA